jgi:hypothetical protein
MLVPIGIFLALTAMPRAQEPFDALARSRDTNGLERLCSKTLANSHPFGFLTHDGTYGTGRYGWRAFLLDDLDGKSKYIVFSTPLTSEDTGEQLFEYRGGLLQRLVHERESLGFRVANHSFSISFDLAAKRANIVDDITISRTGPPRKTLLLRMGPNYTVKRISDAASKPVKFAQAGGVLSVAAPSARSFTYRLSYSGILDKPYYAGSISLREAFLTNDIWWASIARGPAQCRVRAVVPGGWKAIAQGRLVETKAAAGGIAYTYQMDLPVCVYSLSAAPYRVVSRSIEGRQFSVWGIGIDGDAMSLQAELFAPIFKFYERFAPYPFSGYSAVVSDVYGGGALEAYSFATYGGGIPYEDAHEPAHTWWGGIIPNTYLRSLWNESFANFCQGLYQREGAPGNRAERRLAFISDSEPEQAFLQAPAANAPSEIGPAASSIGYEKGSDVLQMLEQEIGTDMMISTMREWIASHKKGEPGEWEDYEQAVKRVVGRDLGWFFDQWLRRTGWADFEVRNVRWNSGKLTGEVAFNGQPYRIACEIMLRFPDGKREFTSFNTMEATTDSGYRFSVPCPMKPALVSVDPWRRLLRTYRPDERLPDIAGCLPRFTKVVDPAHPDWMPHSGRSNTAVLPNDLNGVFIVGSPETLPTMKPLCEAAGFEVEGDSLTYRGTTIDLRRGCALAIVELGGNKRCLIGLGKTRLNPNPGRSQVCVTDDLGRFVRGHTEPKTSGWMTFRLN